MFCLFFISLPPPFSSILLHSYKKERSTLVIDCTDLDKHQSRALIEPRVSEIVVGRSCLGMGAGQITVVDFAKPHRK